MFDMKLEFQHKIRDIWNILHETQKKYFTKLGNNEHKTQVCCNIKYRTLVMKL